MLFIYYKLARKSFRKPRKCKNYKKNSQLYPILFSSKVDSTIQ